MKSSQDVEGLSVLVMGGTAGLGLAAVQALVQHGAHVTVVGREEGELQNLMSVLGGQVQGLAGDACVAQTAEQAVALAVASFGRLDALYHVAGGSGRSFGDGPLHALTETGLEYTLELNLGSVIRSNRAAVRQFLAQGHGGCILNMGSVLGWSPSPEFFSSHAYAAAKAGIVGFSKSVAAYYAPQDIRVNVIAPGLVETPMSQRALGDETIMEFVVAKQPLDGGRAALPGDVTEAALFLLSRSARFITGQVLAVDGGWTVSEGRKAP